MGRNSLLTKPRQAAIVQSILNGSTLEGAAALAGIDPTTISKWKARGRLPVGAKGNGAIYVAFLQAVTRAEEQAIGVALDTLYVAGLGQIADNGTVAVPGDWRAMARWLEMRHPARYGRRLRLDLAEVEEAARLAAEAQGIEGEGAEGAVLAAAEQIAEAAGARRL